METRILLLSAAAVVLWLIANYAKRSRNLQLVTIYRHEKFPRGGPAP